MPAPGRADRTNRPAAASLPFRLDPAVAEAVAEARRPLRGTTRALFDLVCLAGHLGRQLPYRRANAALVAGARDPRRRLRRHLARQIRLTRHAPSASQWRRARAPLTSHLLSWLAGDADDPHRPLRVLVGNASVALAPDCLVPVEPALRAAWDVVLEVFHARYGSAVVDLGRLSWIDNRRLARLAREAAPGARRGRSASGQRPGLEGRRLAIDPRLMRRLSRALGRRVVPGYEARYVFYTKPGDYFFPHPDDPEHALNVLVCLDRRLARGATSGSAFVAYRRDGSVQRHEIQSGCAVAAEARGLIHGREALAPGERVVLLSIAAAYA